jgi:trans-aconitate methyltransferase
MTLSSLLRAYPSLSPSARAHLALRWAMAPLRRIAALVPPEGVVLDLGCGHGLVSLLLARSQPARRVIGLDWDARRLETARTLAEPNLRFEFCDLAGEAPFPAARGILLADVAYLLSPPDQERLLARCAAALEPGGVLVLKETVDAPRWKAALSRFQEALAVRAFGLTRGRALHFRGSDAWVRLLESLGLEVRVVPLDRFRYHPHAAFVARRAAGGAEARSGHAVG